MIRFLAILLLLPFSGNAQTFLVSPDGNIPHDSITMYVTPTQLAAASGGITPADTAAMLLPYLRKVDTTAMLLPYAHKDGSNATGTWPISITGNFTSRTIGIATGDVTSSGSSFNGSANNTNAYTLATVNGNVGSFGSATQVGTFTVNGKGLITAAGNTTVTPAVGSITGLGTGVATALGVNVGTAGAFVVNGGALGTPASGTGTNLTGIPESGVTNLVSDLAGKQSTITFGTGVQTALGVNIGSAGAPVLFNGAGGTPSSLTGTNITGTASGLTAGNVTTNANLTGVVTSVGNATSFATSPAFTGNVTATNTTDITLGAESALRIGGAANSTNLTLGEYSTGVGLQSRNNGAAATMFLQPFGGDLRYGDGSFTGARQFLIVNTGGGTGDYSAMELRNTNASTDALAAFTFGTAWTTAGLNFQDGASLRTGTNLSGGLSIYTQASADLRIGTNNTSRLVIDGALGHFVHATRVEFAQGANVAAANNLTLGSAGNFFAITGNTQINAITNTSWQAGSEITLFFTGTPTVKQNTAGGAGTSPMLLAGAVDFAATANDVLKLIYNGTNWVEVSRSIN